MAHNINFSEAKVYVGTYAKYNDGSIEGKWLDLADYSDIQQFYQACARLHADEHDPEYMFQDYENIPESLISECWISKNIFEVLDAIEALEQKEKEPFFLWCSNAGHDLSKEDTDDLISCFRDEYVGHYDSEEDFAMEYVEENFSLSDFAKSYFDYKQYANDLFSCDYWSDDGHVFRNA